MEKIVKFLGSGKIYKYNGKWAVSLNIVDFAVITNIIIPLFKENPGWYKIIRLSWLM